jgi:hypothetical protein
MRSLARAIVSAALLSLPVLVPATADGQECQSCRDGDRCRDGEPRRWSEEWYAQKGCSPVGTRQKCKCGKLWPPYARPTGEEQECSDGFHANHYWPHPYVCQDRGYVRQVLAQQTVSGWVLETTLYDYHFEPDTHRLTKAGELHLQWILHDVPQQRRAAYVQLTPSAEVNQARMNNIRDMATAMVGAENVPPVYARYATPLGRPAREVNAVRQMELATQPSPRIIYLSSQGGGTAGGSAGGGAGGSGGQ